MGRHKGATMDEEFYEGYTPAVINDNGDVQCPKCASLQQVMKYQIKKYGLLDEYNEVTYCVACFDCKTKYCFSQHFEEKKGKGKKQ